ncbi:hypothetical protein TYRP_022673 [Tyrophagus putrescentiae]|nr:hypothetical protein TYRP_022673 [Tyrophagus putrescentiae]
MSGCHYPPPPQGPGFWAEESPPPIIDTGENLGNQEQFRGGGSGGNSQSPQVESVKDPILISTKLPTDAADTSAESGQLLKYR